MNKKLILIMLVLALGTIINIPSSNAEIVLFNDSFDDGSLGSGWDKHPNDFWVFISTQHNSSPYSVALYDQSVWDEAKASSDLYFNFSTNDDYSLRFTAYIGTPSKRFTVRLTNGTDEQGIIGANANQFLFYNETNTFTNGTVLAQWYSYEYSYLNDEYKCLIDGFNYCEGYDSLKNFNATGLTIDTGISPSSFYTYIDDIMFIKPYFINVKAKDYYTQEYLKNFTIKVYYPNGSNYLNISTVNNSERTISLLDKPEGNYSFIFQEDNYLSINQTVYFNDTENLNLTYITFPTTNLSLNFYDDITKLLIDEEIRIILTNQTGGFKINYTSSGEINYTNIIAENYSLRLTSENYSSFTTSLNLTQGIPYILNSYLLPSDAPKTVFSFKDKDTGNGLEGVILSVQSLINGSWTVSEVLTSDITGKTRLTYQEGENYKFLAILEDYTTKIFSLSPILFDTYTVNMEKSVSVPQEQDYAGVNILISPNKYYNNATNNVSFTFISPDGQFTAYGFNLSLGVGVVSFSGSNAYGETLTYSSVITNADLTDRVLVKYYYTLNNGVHKEYEKVHSIIGGYTTNTWLTNLGANYGMGMFERILIVTLLLVAVGGLITYYAGAVAGGVLSMLVMGLFVYTGFIPFWTVAISIIMLFIIVGWRSSL